MSRLTHMHKGYGVLNEFKDPCEAITKLAEYEDTGLTPERCAELAKAESEGRLVVLPMALGAKAYRIGIDLTHDVLTGEMHQEPVVYETEFHWCWLEEFGFTVFDSYKDAVAEIQGKGDETKQC